MKSENKKKHKESTIGKIIYGFMLFAPLIAIATACLTQVFNAGKDTEIIYKYETNEVNSNDDLKIGNIYHFDTRNSMNPFLDFNFNSINLEIGLYDSLQDIYFDEFYYEDSIYYINNDTCIDYYGYDSYILIFFNDNGTLSNYISVFLELGQQTLDLGNNYISGDIVINEFYQIFNDSYLLFSKCENVPIESVVQANQEDVFYRALDKVSNSNYFKWAKNTAIYTGIQATSNILGITNTFMPMLLAYWLIISVLYFLYDIILMMLNILHRKIHELQDEF